MRRGTFRDETVDYAAVGATQAPDLMQYPAGAQHPGRGVLAHRQRRGPLPRPRATLSCRGRAQRGAGLELSDVRPAAGPMYSGVSFDAEGNPLAPSRLEADQRFDTDGTPYVGAGHDRSASTAASAGMRADAELRVIFAIEEPRRVGFALGTVGGSVVSGEESFMLQWYDNDEVWFTVRAFDAPSAFLYRVFPGADPPAPARAVHALPARDLAAVRAPRPDGLRAPARRARTRATASLPGRRSTTADAVRGLPARARSAACGAATATSTPTRPASCAARGRTSTPTRCCARSTSRAACSRTPAPLRPAQPRCSSAAARPRCCRRATSARMLDGVRAAFGIAPGAEVTVEANPDTVTDAVAAELGGIRRHPAVDRHAVRRPARARGARSHARARRTSRTAVARGAPRRARRQRRPHLRRAGGVARGLARVARDRRSRSSPTTSRRTR